MNKLFNFFLEKNSKELGRETEKTPILHGVRHSPAHVYVFNSLCVSSRTPEIHCVYILITTPARFCDSWKSTLLLFELSSTTLHSFETGIADENSNLNRRKMISFHEN